MAQGEAVRAPGGEWARGAWLGVVWVALLLEGMSFGARDPIRDFSSFMGLRIVSLLPVTFFSPGCFFLWFAPLW